MKQSTRPAGRLSIPGKDYTVMIRCTKRNPRAPPSVSGCGRQEMLLGSRAALMRQSSVFLHVTSPFLLFASARA
jgi:hypothetical protein